MTALLFSEGPLDLGDSEPFGDDLTDGPLRVLIRKVLDDSPRVVIESRRLSRVHGGRERHGLKGFALKALRAHNDARREGAEAAFIVIDEDGRRGVTRLGELERGRAAASGAPPSALGVAVPMVESWLMGDAGGWARCFGADPGVPGDPEADTGARGSRKPYCKTALRRLARVERGERWPEVYTRIAESLDWRVVAATCRRSFGPFANEVRRNVGPAFGVKASLPPDRG